MTLDFSALMGVAGDVRPVSGQVLVVKDVHIVLGPALEHVVDGRLQMAEQLHDVDVLHIPRELIR